MGEGPVKVLLVRQGDLVQNLTNFREALLILLVKNSYCIKGRELARNGPRGESSPE